MNRLFPFLIAATLCAEEPYRIGSGVTVAQTEALQLKLGAHVNTRHTLSDDAEDTLALTQAGILAYGTLLERLHFLGEVGAEDGYVYRIEADESTDNPLILNRLYLAYDVDTSLTIKAGQFLTPVGIFNPTYIGALRWTAVTPFVAEGFFPKVIAGIDLGGRFGPSFEYDLFYHIGGETDRNPNAVHASEFVGGELRYVFGLDGRIAVPAGRFRSESSKEICHFTGVNFELPLGTTRVSGELLYKNGSWDEDHWAQTQRWEELAWYLQLVQPVIGEHYATLRYGENKRSQKGWYNERNGVAGYVYRPWQALSFKAEYRYFGHQVVTGHRHTHSANLSIGVLF